MLRLLEPASMRMSADSNLVASLVDRLATRLPHRTGSNSQDLRHDEVVALTRATLISVSINCFDAVAESLLLLLEELSRSQKAINLHPAHILHSEIYIIHLLADCCSEHWNNAGLIINNGRSTSSSSHSSSSEAASKGLQMLDSNRERRRLHPVNRTVAPKSLDDTLVSRILDAVKLFQSPIPEGYTLPASNILDDGISTTAQLDIRIFPDSTSSESSQGGTKEAVKLLEEKSEEVGLHIRVIVEFVSASNWSYVLEHLQTTFRGQQGPYASQATRPGILNSSSVPEDETDALITLQLVALLWVDSRKLGQIIQEVCGCFLHLKKAFQSTVAIVLPLLITRWLEQNPIEFVDLHVAHKRLDGGADTLFDMTNSMVDSGRWKALLFPFQTALVYLLPDVFEVASNMRDAKSSGMVKKVAFLEGLRKALRNRNPSAAYCLVSILRVARHFGFDGDSALLSFALDVQDEVQEALFRRVPPGNDSAVFDESLMTAAFVSLTHLSFDTCNKSLAPLCLAANAPQDFKIAYVSACCYFARQPNVEYYQPLFSQASEFIRFHLKGLSVDRGDQPSDDQYLLLKQLDTSSSLDLTYRILSFLDVLPLILFNGAPTNAPESEQFYEENLAALVACLTSDDERIRYLTSTVARKLMVDGTSVLLQSSLQVSSKSFYGNFWRSTSIVLLAASDKFNALNGQDRVILSFINDYLSSRVSLLKSIKEIATVHEDVPERLTASIKLETLFLVSLCSPKIEICQLVTSCVALLCEEHELIDAAVGSTKASLPTLRNLRVYQELSSRDFRFTGLVAFQKRVRSLLRKMAVPGEGILSAWETVFDKWFDLSKRLSSSRPTDVVDETSLVEWRNYSGFLASLAGACVQTAMVEESVGTTLKWIDRPSTDNYDETLLSRYMTQSIQLLGCNNVRIREATREVLSNEITPSLYLALFKTLESELESLFDGAHASSSRTPESRINFAEQAAALLRTIVERLGTLTEFGATLPIDIGVLTLNFAKFLNSTADNSNSLRIKIKLCQLCEVVTRKRELLNLRHDVRIRNQLLDITFGWIARPGSPRFNSSAAGSSRADETLRLQRDLDKSCLKALADLTYRLPLQPADGQSDADTSDLKSQMFHTYFNRFLSLLHFEGIDVARNDVQAALSSREEVASTPDLAIVALSNLLSANIDVGLKHSLGIGYHEDSEIRTAFVRVLCNILAQGTEFNSLSDAAVSERYDELVELLLHDMAVTIALCDACPSTEVDELTISLLNIFDSRGLGFVLLQALIDHEVEQTENEAELLRRNCVTTKMLSIYAKWKGASYLKTTLQKVLERLIVTAQDLDLELDPARTSSQEELQKNALQLRVVTKVFIDDICGSAAHIPVSFRKICSIISTSVTVRFPEAKFTAVGAFIFLRFFCPAIVAPDAEGLISSTPSKEMRRGLLLIAKIVQNLANNVLFGAKESYMFPLNDFLTQNIYRVTTFLREISAPSNIADPFIETESFDFGSCVALHRFLYDHWDHVHQKLIARERKVSSLRSPINVGQDRVPILDALRVLITNLGPPPMDISWNRPMISANSPPSYSRFQHFMLRNAGRNTESIVSTRAVYDGGESKDSLSMICIILRNIDAESADYDLLLYCYFKIASRMWHRPFGILIDATCYNGQNEPQDAMFRKLDLLTPSELSKNLSRVYVYNMNSAFRKCFRRILRLSAKSDSSAFHPKNVDYHLIGSLQDLQSHFHLSQLHLPKETISVVTDTRFVFQPIIRLSKTKGKIEVVIKVGSQFVQVTTTKKQEIVPGLRLHATVNDIFRLNDVDEAPTSIQTEDDSAFGLRTESGKIVMYFTSPKKTDILQTIRGAKVKYGKDLKTPITFERLIRPQDVPGTLLNIALTNMASINPTLRVASYNLLCALCQAFKFAATSKFMTARELAIPPNPTQFIVEISSQLALSEPQLTADFLNEFFVGWESFPFHQRPLSLAYMAPWLPGLRTHVLATEADGEKAREKVAVIFRKLIDVAMSDLSLGITLEQSIWPAICHDEVHTEILLEELIKAALAHGFYDSRTDALGSIICSLGTVTVRGKLLSRLRKALNRSSLRPTRHLPDNSVWPEIGVLLRLCLSMSFDNGVQSQLYLPELFHIITMLSNTGSADIRLVVHRLLVNTIHALCTNFALEDTKFVRIRAILGSLSEPRNEIHHNIMGVARDGIFSSPTQESGGSVLSSTETLASLLSEISTIGAPTIDLSNAWRSRWMSLVASTAFQSNPAIQPRAFTVMGCLAREDVDDDLLYQVLVALRNSISRFVGDNDDEMLVAIVTSLTKMMERLPTASRYGLQLFWLALSLVRHVPLVLFNCAASFLEAVLININTSGEFKNGRMVQVLLQGRQPVEDPASQLDESYGVHFNAENFHFAVCASLVKGLTDTVTKSTTIRVLSTFLEIASSCSAGSRKFPEDLTCLPYLGLVMSRALTSEEAKGTLWLAGVNSDLNSAPEDILAMIDLSSIRDKELLLNAAISIVDFRILEDNVQTRGLLWLNRVALKRPTVILHLYDPVSGILEDVLLSCQNAVTLEAAHALLRTLTSNPKLSGNLDTARLLEDVLEDIGFGGLWRSSTFHAVSEQDKRNTILTDKLIELIIA